MVRTIFGMNDNTPRGIQERKDMHWVVLAIAHRKLRMELQQKLLQATTSEGISSQMMWQEESKEQLKDLLEKAVSHLDEETDIGGMKLKKLRPEVQSLLEPQIIQLLNIAHDVENEMYEEGEDYIFSEEEEEEYKNILLEEYKSVCQLLEDRRETNDTANTQNRRADPVPFYEMKKGAIESLLTYFEWWPEDSAAPTANNTDMEGYVDEFGFSPSNSDTEIIPAMRYYHVRNMVRSSLARRAPVEIITRTSTEENANAHDMYGYHSLLPLKSTIPSAGRGVFVDGFAPAGTHLAFIPGQIWPKEHLQSATLQTQMQLSEDPRHQLSLRYDDILIDSRHSPYTVVKNLWALGHIFNHPPPPTPESKVAPEQDDEESDDIMPKQPHQGPNCVTVPINFTDKMIEGDMEKLRDFIPNEYEHKPKEWAKSKSLYEKDDVIMHGMGLVALRDVKDEELFYDYRLSPESKEKGGGGGNQYPSWYYVWDQEAINNRWDKDDS